MRYEGVGNVIPYGPEPMILQRSSMFAFALGGFLMGFGSQLARGDLLFFSCSEISQGHWISLLLVGIMYLSAFFTSWILSTDKLGLITNQEINPTMVNLHWVSANITIALSFVALTVSICGLYGQLGDKRKVAKKVGCGFLTGVLIMLGFGICGLSVRTRTFQGLTPNGNFDPFLIVFLLAVLLFNTIVYFVIQKYPLLYPEHRPAR
jgi:hypothetical protein